MLNSPATNKHPSLMELCHRWLRRTEEAWRFTSTFDMNNNKFENIVFTFHEERKTMEY